MMHACPACPGLVPARASRCPNCDTPIAPPSRLGAGVRALSALLGGGAIAMTLMACYGLPPCDASEDVDQDGVFPGHCYNSAPLVDCDDGDPTIHPCADDPSGDGVDQNCDGVDGLAATSSTSTTAQPDLCEGQPPQ